jgi:hypothetical protein
MARVGLARQITGAHDKALAAALEERDKGNRCEERGRGGKWHETKKGQKNKKRSIPTGDKQAGERGPNPHAKDRNGASFYPDIHFSPQTNFPPGTHFSPERHFTPDTHFSVQKSNCSRTWP